MTQDIDPRPIANYLIENGQLEYAEHLMILAAAATPAPQSREFTGIKIPMKSLRFGCDYFGKKNMEDFTENSTESEKWLFNELTKAYCEGAKDFAAAPQGDAVAFLDSIRDYERENGERICNDERTSEELYQIFLSTKTK